MTRRLQLLLLLVVAVPAAARVISYAPFTDRIAAPAAQHRMNRHFVLVEALPNTMFQRAQVVLYDTRSEREPVVIFPQDGSYVSIMSAAVRENSAGVPAILIHVYRNGAHEVLLSTDAGTTWNPVAVPRPAVMQLMAGVDTGGPFAAASGSQILIGTEADPFVLAGQNRIYVINSSGIARVIAQQPNARLAGTDREGRRVLVQSGTQLVTIDTVTGAASNPGSFPGALQLEGWIAPDGAAYVRQWVSTAITLWHLTNGATTKIMEVPPQGVGRLFAIPTFDYSGAWIIRRGNSVPTSLYRHTAGAGLVKQWDDVTAPEVEALHAGSSGERLLVQVHIPRRQADQRLFIDPALAIWKVGEQEPRDYDELFLNEETNKGFVHLDVEATAAGKPFVFDAGIRWSGGQGGVSAGGGGGDIVQEWGVVRGSLKQTLILPSVGRTSGGFGSFWTTDVIFYNPYDEPQVVETRYKSETDSMAAQTTIRAITLAAREIRLVPDALQSLFGRDSGLGSLYITPARSVSVTSRTYSRSASGVGTFGFGMHAIDLYAGAASSRFPVTFAGAFPGNDFRTNVVITDTSGTGTTTSMSAAGLSGPIGLADLSFATGATGQLRINGVGTHLGLLPFETGSLTVRPTKGQAIASVFVTDNRTNDATYFPPDLPAPVVRTIPAIGHVDGAFGSQFRSDLFLYNPSTSVRTVVLQAQMWDVPQQMNLQMTLLPKEARVIRDVLKVAFGRTGIARLRYQSQGEGDGIRVTARTYSTDANGGTFGFLMPPLNNFQSGAAGDTLEILGAVADSRFRTNIGLVELSPWATAQTTATARISIVNSTGIVLDTFIVNVPMTGGMQLNDVFNARAINASGPVLIRVSPLSGHIGAYGAFVDNTTNDSLYLAANLAASE